MSVNKLWQGLWNKRATQDEETPGAADATASEPQTQATEDHSREPDTAGPQRKSPLDSLGGGPVRRTQGTLGHWDAKGLGQRQGQQFALDIQNIPAIGQFARVLPAWSQANNCEVRLTIEARPGWNGGAAVELTFDRKDLPISMGQDLLARLETTGALMALTQTIEHMKSIGADPAYIDPLVDEADQLAKSLQDGTN